MNSINEEYFFQQISFDWIIFFLTKNIRPLDFRLALPFVKGGVCKRPCEAPRRDD